MPTKKKSSPSCCSGEEKLRDLAGKAKEAARQAKEKFDSLDPADKKKVVAGAAGVAAAIVGALGLRKITKKK
jgi:hypothetical protein